jgi:nucleoside-diphosphate-sugar epimerase
MSRVLVTGAGGFIGRPACALLRERGFEVIDVGSPTSTETTYQVDLLDARAVDELVEKAAATHLLHLAWITTPQYWTALENVRWTAGSLHLVDAFRRRGGQRCVVAGTCAEYDWSYSRCIEDETPTTPATLYGTAKHALRLLLAAYAAQSGLSFAWGRVFFAYGPGERQARLVPTVIRGLVAGERVPCTQGTQRRDFLFVDDVADAFATIVASSVTGAINIGSGTAFSLRELVERIADKLDGRERLEFGALPIRDDDPPELVADVSKLTSEVGWHPRISLDVGITRTIDWWRAKAKPS